MFPSNIYHATLNYNAAIREALESILGSPLSDWSWTKVSLPSSHGGINLHSASLHAPAAFLASDHNSRALVEHMLGCELGPSQQSDTTLAALSAAAARLDWKVVGDIDLPLKQHALSVAICTNISFLPHPLPEPVPWHSHQPCLMLVIGSMAFHLQC